jgi:hypothetical protein
MRTIKHHLFVAALLILSTSAFADVSEATFTPQGRTTYAPIQEQLVEIFVLKPGFKFYIIGTIEARGMAESDNSLFSQLDSLVGNLLGSQSPQPGEKEDIALAMRALRREAALNGAMGVLILRSIQARVSSNATERRIIGAAFRPE